MKRRQAKKLSLRINELERAITALTTPDATHHVTLSLAGYGQEYMLSHWCDHPALTIISVDGLTITAYTSDLGRVMRTQSTWSCRVKVTLL